MKKTTNILLIAVLALGISVGTLVTTCQQAAAVGVIGSNAIKSVVIGSMEKAGVSFGSKEAKDKAFDAWNMKAYEKWQADEAAGRNADLWAQWHAFEQNPSSAMRPVPDAPDKPGVGRFLLDATIFGMAIGIGADIGYAIQDAQLNDKRMQYFSDDLPIYDGVTFNSHIGVVMSEPYYRSDWWRQDANFPDGTRITHVNSPYKEDPNRYFHITGLTRNANGTVTFTYLYSGTNWDGSPNRFTETFTLAANDYAKFAPDNGYRYEAVPLPDHVPNIRPNPHLEPLIAPYPDFAVIPELLPVDVPVEVVIPSEPEIDPFWDGEINDPYAPPGTDPGKDPDAPPGTDPDKDPDAPPGTDPDGDPDAPPGTDPGKDEETPPGKDEEQPPKEDEENSCGESLKKPDFKKVGVAFTNAFPFSLPWDLKRFFDAAFSGIGSEKPSVDLTFLGDGVTLTIPDYFDSWVDVAKNLMVILFDISLIWMFARFMQRGGGD